MKRAISLTVLIFLSQTSFAQKTTSQNENNQQALRQTQEVLRNPEKRAQALKADPKAAQQNQKIENALGKDHANEAYNISADVMGNLNSASGGDPVKMQQMLEQAQKDPQGFYNSLTPEQQAAIKSLAGKIEAERSQQNPVPNKK